MLMLGKRWKKTTENEAIVYARSIRLQRDFVVGQIKHVKSLLSCQDRIGLNSILEATDKIVTHFRKSEISKEESRLCLEWNGISSRLREASGNVNGEVSARLSNLIRQFDNL